MSRPADISLLDEARSIQLYLSLVFPDDEIRRSKPHEDEAYDMLLDFSSEQAFEARGTYMADSTLPITVQRWCEDHDEALETVETMQRLFRKGLEGYWGERSRVPVWDWSEFAGAAPDALLEGDEPDRFLRVEDLETRVLPADEPTKYVAVCDLRLRGWRITHTHTDQLINAIDLARE